MKLLTIENIPLRKEEQIFKNAFLSGDRSLWSKSMTIAEYEKYDAEGLIAHTEMSKYYREKSKDQAGVTIDSVSSISNAAITLHRRYSYPVLHNHEYVEIIYVAEGHCTNYVNEVNFDLTTGDVCIMAPHSLHALSCTNDDSCILNIMVNRKFFDRSFLRILRSGQVLVDFLEKVLYERNVSPYILYPTGCDEWLRTLCRHMMTETVMKPHAYEYAVSLLTSSFLLHLAREWEMYAIVPDQQSRQNSLIVAVLGYLSVNFSHATLAGTAEFFGYSPAYLSRMLHENTGKTFNAIITQFQMERAADLLTTSSKSLTEIAHEIGCFDSSHFGKKFRKYYGVLPKQYAALRQEGL